MASQGSEVGRRTGARALAAGLAGAFTVTALNEVGRRTLSSAPRAELLGARGVRKLAGRLGRRPSRAGALRLALAGELVSNGLYYATPALSPRPLLTGLVLGALAGWGAVALPPRLGLGRWPTRRSARTRALSFTWYLAAGAVAGLVARRGRRAPALARLEAA
jgi:hypothetical protein